jgi:hypothetical protein
VARNDPTDTGGLFIGRRPGTAPLRLRPRPDGPGASPARRRFDAVLAGTILFSEIVLCLSLWGPQPAAGLWVGSQVNYLTGSVVAGILVAFIVIMTTLALTLVVLRRLDHTWKLVRRAAGHQQKHGMLERVFVATVVIGVVGFLFWFFIIAGPGSMLVPERPA